MQYSRIRDVLPLTRGTEKSAGIDFYVPKFTNTFVNDLRLKNATSQYEIFQDSVYKIYLRPHHRLLIPSGIKVAVNHYHALIAFNKSGVASKKGLDVLACVVDEDYQGEVHISVVNTSDVTQVIQENEKLVQFILVPITYSNLTEIPLEELYPEITERADGGFGSTNKSMSTEVR
jgi:dUTP pyrophosphatase